MIRLGLLLLVVAAVAAPAFSQSSKPAVPPGRNPGGWPVAFIGPGIDYTRPEIAQRMARDGEGEIAGWDFVDGDRRPWRACTPGDVAGCGTLSAQTVLSEHGASALIVVRATSVRPQTFVDAMKLVAQGPAKIVLLMADGPLPYGFIDDAARRLPALLLVVPATRDGEQAAEAANVIVVAAMALTSNVRGADIAVPAAVALPGGASVDRALNDVAAARVAALASRLQAVEPGLDAAALKLRIVALATRPVDVAAARLRYGVIERPERPFRLE